jgi:hypothetical protein
MPRVREFLDRFRPAGAPGAATATGVPVERRLGLETELAPVFAALAGVQEECAAVCRLARQEATDLSRRRGPRRSWPERGTGRPPREPMRWRGCDRRPMPKPRD